jgi:hypothetical protein
MLRASKITTLRRSCALLTCGQSRGQKAAPRSNGAADKSLGPGDFLIYRLRLNPYDEWNTMLVAEDARTASILDMPICTEEIVQHLAKTGQPIILALRDKLRAAHDEVQRTHEFGRFQDIYDDTVAKVKRVAQMSAPGSSRRIKPGCARKLTVDPHFDEQASDGGASDVVVGYDAARAVALDWPAIYATNPAASRLRAAPLRICFRHRGRCSTASRFSRTAVMAACSGGSGAPEEIRTPDP